MMIVTSVCGKKLIRHLQNKMHPNVLGGLTWDAPISENIEMAAHVRHLRKLRIGYVIFPSQRACGGPRVTIERRKTRPCS